MTTLLTVVQVVVVMAWKLLTAVAMVVGKFVLRAGKVGAGAVTVVEVAQMAMEGRTAVIVVVAAAKVVRLAVEGRTAAVAVMVVARVAAVAAVLVAGRAVAVVEVETVPAAALDTMA